MKKVREQRNFEICIDNMRGFEIEIFKYYLNRDLCSLSFNIERHYNLTLLTKSKKTQIDNVTKIFEIVFECYTYYNNFNELCEIEIIKFV